MPRAHLFQSLYPELYSGLLLQYAHCNARCTPSQARDETRELSSLQAASVTVTCLSMANVTRSGTEC